MRAKAARGWPGGARARKRSRAKAKATGRLLGKGKGAPDAREHIRKLMLSMRGAPKASGARATLIEECMSPIPDRKAFLRAWAKGGRFDHEPTESWPGMYLSSVGGLGADTREENKDWLWSAMAREGADLAQTGARGMGFEALATESGDARALKWWRSQGMGIDRLTGEGRSVWSVAFERAPSMAGLLKGLWPESADAARVSEELYGLEAEVEAKRLAGLTLPQGAIGARIFGRPGAMMMPPSIYTQLVLAPAMGGWAKALREWPELVRANARLSSFMRACGAAPEAVAGVEGLEREAMARAEREELAMAARGGEAGAKRGAL